MTEQFCASHDVGSTPAGRNRREEYLALEAHGDLLLEIGRPQEL